MATVIVRHVTLHHPAWFLSYVLLHSGSNRKMKENNQTFSFKITRVTKREGTLTSVWIKCQLIIRMNEAPPPPLSVSPTYSSDSKGLGRHSGGDRNLTLVVRTCDDR